MRHPPYHLRTNKAVDRLLFAEAIRWSGSPKEISKYKYYGFGGPYLEDFRLLHDNFPEMEMVCIEKDAETSKRQRFHLPCSRIELQSTEFDTFLANYESGNRKSIFWLDNTGLKYSHFEDFISLLRKVAPNSIVKLSLQCKSNDYIDKLNETTKLDKFNREYGAIVPGVLAAIPVKFLDYANLLQQMIQLASAQALPPEMEMVFQPISSFYYIDLTGMLTLTGMVCRVKDQKKIKNKFSKWKFANLEWDNPKVIDVPHLSIKERLQFQSVLPNQNDDGTELYDVLGYNIDSDQPNTILKLEQYASFCRYYPHFIKAIP